MKKLITISFAIFYLLTSIGVTVSVHKCMGQIASVKLFTETGICCCSNEKPMDGCCEDESLFVQLDNDHQIIQSLRISDIADAETIRAPELSLPAIVIAKKEIRAELFDLPPPSKHPLWLLNSNFTFYG